MNRRTKAVVEVTKSMFKARFQTSILILQHRYTEGCGCKVHGFPKINSSAVLREKLRVLCGWGKEFNP